MSNIKFFSNNIVFVDGTQGESTVSLAGTRPTPITVFDVPEHTVGTPNLLIFLDGKLQISGRDYTDINSKQVLFPAAIAETVDIAALLIRSENKAGGGGGGTGSDLEWGSF